MPPSFHVRRATLCDVPRITTVCLAGLPDDPAFDFLWRYRHQYPEDSYFFWQQKYKADVNDPRKIVLVAVETADCADRKEDREGAVETIVAYAVWERNVGQSNMLELIGSPLKIGGWNLLHRLLTKIENWAIGHEFKRHDGDPMRMAAFFETMNKVHAKYWETLYPKNYRLELLATHPDYRKRGAATELIQWGIEKAAFEGVDVGVESSPMGLPLYLHLEFILQETLTVTVEGDDATLLVRVMLHNKSKE